MEAETETFWTLLHNVAHWEFEIFLMLLFDVVIGLIIWPKFSKWVLHHKSDDQKLEELQLQCKKLQIKVNRLSRKIRQ